MDILFPVLFFTPAIFFAMTFGVNDNKVMSLVIPIIIATVVSTLVLGWIASLFFGSGLVPTVVMVAWLFGLNGLVIMVFFQKNS